MEQTGSFDSGALPSLPSDTDGKLRDQGDSLQLAHVKRVSPATSEGHEAFIAASASITSSHSYEANGKHYRVVPSP